MMNATTHYRFPRKARALRPVFGLAAAFAAAATLGLAVVAPTLVERAEPAYAGLARAAVTPTEVAILPGTIEVVATRTRSAAATVHYVPASFGPRG